MKRCEKCWRCPQNNFPPQIMLIPSLATPRIVPQNMFGQMMPSRMGPAGMPNIPQGVVGPTGPQGPRGEQGPPGEPIQLAIGDVTSGDEASVTDEVSGLKHTLSFTLPRGERGPSPIKLIQTFLPSNIQGNYFTELNEAIVEPVGSQYLVDSGSEITVNEIGLYLVIMQGYIDARQIAQESGKISLFINNMSATETEIEVPRGSFSYFNKLTFQDLGTGDTVKINASEGLMDTNVHLELDFFYIDLESIY